MNKSTALIVLASVLAAGYTVAGHASQEAALVSALSAPHPVADIGRAPIAIPSNALTGRGALATPDGRVHY